MAQTFSTVISIVPETKVIQFYQSVGTDKNSLRLDTKPYNTRQFDEEFFDGFTKELQAYSQSNPSYSGKAAKVTVLLPNRLIITDSVNIPGVSRKNIKEMTNTAIEARYRNVRELKINNFTSSSNKQYSTVNLVVIRQKLVQSIYTSCASSNMFANTITFHGNAMVNGAIALNGKLKAGTFLLLDVKRDRSVLSYVVKGITVGSYVLPFGVSLLEQQKVVAENMLFEHSVAELAVLNAKEKAKAKALTMMGNTEENAESEGLNVLTGEDNPNAATTEGEESAFGGTATTRPTQTQIKSLPKKQPRTLPKFMQRPVPETEQGVVFENYRYFVKWVLEFVRGNSRLTAIGQPETVYVNMPAQYDYLYEMVNAEKEENHLEFVPLGLDKERDIVRDNLELYGALFAAQFNTCNNF